MPFCRNCGASVREDDSFCVACGSRQHAVKSTVPEAQTEDTQLPHRRRYNKLFVCTLLHLIFLCIPTGLIALFYAFRAESAENMQESQKARHTAWMIITISSACVFALFIFGFTFFVALAYTSL